MKGIEAMKKINIGIPFDYGDSTEFDTENRFTDLVNAETRAQEGGTRNKLAIGVSVFSACALSIAATIGFFDGSYNELQSIWVVLGPLAGAVLYYYFCAKEK